MRVFVAGGSGTIGVPLVRALVAAGHQVTALTRTPGKADELRGLGATPSVADALDAAALLSAVADARPTHVIHQLTALPKHGVRRTSDLDATNRLREEGTRNLIDAAIRAGAKRFIGGSFAVMPGPGVAVPDGLRAAAGAVRSMESQIVDASTAGRIEGIVLRYGLFYGPGNPATDQMLALVRRRRLPVVRGDHGRLPCIHLADAVSATIAALDRGVPGRVYDIVDDEAVSLSQIVATLADQSGSPRPFTVPKWVPKLLSPYMARFMDVEMPLSNAPARADLDWRPLFPTWRDGIADMFSRAA